jgi:hypothetical protein
MIGKSPNNRTNCHDLRPDPLHRAFHHGVVQISQGVHSLLRFELVPRMIEIEQHHPIAKTANTSNTAVAEAVKLPDGRGASV